MNSIPKNRYLVFFLILIFGVALDLGSKYYSFETLGHPGHFKPEYPQHNSGWLFETKLLSFQFYTTFNEGALWGVGQGYSWLFALLSGVAVLGVFYWLFVAGAAHSKWLTVALALIMSGTLGNLWDRLAWHGYIHPIRQEPWYAVRDFLLFRIVDYDWPVFNFADVFLVTGAIMLIIQSFMLEPEAAASASSQQKQS